MEGSRPAREGGSGEAGLGEGEKGGLRRDEKRTFVEQLCAWHHIKSITRVNSWSIEKTHLQHLCRSGPGVGGQMLTFGLLNRQGAGRVRS